ncbi:MAG: magnesium chelatase ATPase subunit D, partial [Pseudomonadota bacterium]
MTAATAPLRDAEAAGAARWRDAVAAAALLAVDPAGLFGASVRAAPGPVRDRWIEALKAMRGAASFLTAPHSIDEERLIGGLDLAASLRAGAPVAERGLLARADGGVLLLRMADRASASVAASIAAALDQRTVIVERSGVSSATPTSFSLVMLDEGAGPDEAAPRILCDRVAFLIDLEGVRVAACGAASANAKRIEAARALLGDVTVSDDLMAAVNAAAIAHGVVSVRALQFAIRATRAAAALHGRF